MPPALDFPNSPTNGQQYAAPNGATYQWDGVVWAVVPVGSAPPSGPAGGDLTGSYPNPTIAKLAGAAVGTTTPLARGDILAANATPALTRVALGAASTALQSNGTDAVWATLPWSVSGSTLTPTDATKTVSVPGGAAGAGTANVLLGSNTAKARVQTSNTTTPAWLSASVNWDVGGGTQDDATKPSWQLALNASADQLIVQRRPAGGSGLNLLTLTNTGVLQLTGVDGNSEILGLTGYTASGSLGTSMNTVMARGTAAAPSPILAGDIIVQLAAYGQYSTTPGNYSAQGTLSFRAAENWSATARGTNCYIYTTPVGSTSAGSNVILDQGGNILISGSIGQKASGTTWQNPSDPRLKTDVAPYTAGLAEIAHLEPITYRLKAQPDGPLCYGFDAAKVRDVFPECVSSRRMKLDPADEEETDGVLSFDIHPILVALVNAVKELTARVSALEGAAA